jgi:hypothetical protein
MHMIEVGEESISITFCGAYLLVWAKFLGGVGIRDLESRHAVHDVADDGIL